MLLNVESKFSNENYGKVLVPLRAPRYQEKMFELAQTGHNDLFGTDHAPHTLEEKQQSFEEAPSGFPSIDFAVKILFSLFLQEKLPLKHLVNGYAIKPAEIFNISDKGRIAPNFDADLVLIKEVSSYPLDSSMMKGKQTWSPWLDFQVNADIDHVWISGNDAFDSTEQTIHPFGKKIRKGTD
jgi:dihydroorotase